MREIKFRAWVLKSKAMFDVTDDISYYVGDKGVSLMQYTGLKDKSGVEIYEGDIIAFNVGMEGDCVEQVFWSKDGAKFMHTFSDRPNKAFWQNTNFLDELCEVIGNIHENPELLK